MTDGDTPKSALVRIVAPLDPARAAIVRETFSAMFDKLESWQDEAQRLTVTDEKDAPRMKRARILRLEIKAVRVELDKRRKALKEGILTEGRAIDGAFSVFLGLSEPIERFLLEQEKFAERAESARKDALRAARQAALLALGTQPAALPASLGEMSEDAWAMVLDDARDAKAAREDRERVEREAKAEADRLVAEKEAERRKAAEAAEVERRARELAQREENERLKREAEARDAELSAERAKLQAEERKRLDAERARHKAAAEAQEAANESAERVKVITAAAARAVQEAEKASATMREDARRAQAEADAARAELARKAAMPLPAPATLEIHGPMKPTRQTVLVLALQRIAQLGEPKSAPVARKALEDVGVPAPEAPPAAVTTLPAPPAADDEADGFDDLFATEAP